MNTNSENSNSILTSNSTESNAVEFPVVGQGPATVYEGEITRYTDPDLHRFVEHRIPSTAPDAHTESEVEESYEIGPRFYELSILGTDSYRTTTKYLHIDYQDLCIQDPSTGKWVIDRDKFKTIFGVSIDDYPDSDSVLQQVQQQFDSMERREIP